MSHPTYSTFEPPKLVLPKLIQDRIDAIENITALSNIDRRARSRFFERNFSEVIAFEMLDYISSQIKWRRYDLYKWGSALFLRSYEHISEDFASLFFLEIQLNNLLGKEVEKPTFDQIHRALFDQ